jgi:hypothetical protein
MEIIAFLSLLILVSTIGTFIFAIGSYIIFRIKSIKEEKLRVENLNTFTKEIQFNTTQTPSGYIITSVSSAETNIKSNEHWPEPNRFMRYTAEGKPYQESASAKKVKQEIRWR